MLIESNRSTEVPYTSQSAAKLTTKTTGRSDVDIFIYGNSYRSTKDITGQISRNNLNN